MNLTRSKVSLLYVVVIISLLAFISVSSYIASSNMENEMNSVVSEVFPLSVVSENLLEDIINQETGVRGYEVTHDVKYLDPYNMGKEELARDLASMADYQKKYPRLKSLVEGDILPQIQRLQDFHATQIDLVRTGKYDEALARTNTGKNMMDRFRQLHLKLGTEIDMIAANSFNHAKDAGRMARIIISVGGGAALIVGLFSAIIFRRANRAESQLRKSEETYRFMAESLEVQNEEIIAQQEEQEQTLEKLSQREMELEAISMYQEKLTGSLEMSDFLRSAMPSLLQSLQMDAALLVIKDGANVESTLTDGAESFRIMYAIGYPEKLPQRVEAQLFGPALRVFKERVPIECKRDLSDSERGFHQSMTQAFDHYYPLFNDNTEIIGFLLLTDYITSRGEQKERIAKGLVRQFGMAFLAQMMNEDRHRQSIRLKQLNQQLVKEKYLIEEQRDLIENILESTHEGMMLVDAKGRLQFANQLMVDEFSLVGRIGDDFTRLFPENNNPHPSITYASQSVQGLLEGALDKITERFEFVSRSGQQRYIELYATKVGDSSNRTDKGFLFVFRDRTQEEKVDEMKNEFISIVSHELRTPLASVLGFIEILLHRKLAPDKQEKYLQTIYKEANRLSTLINDFLDLQRMESGKQIYHFAPLNLPELVKEVADQWKGKQDHKIELILPQQELWVRADSDRFKQVIHNLVSNAFKYSPDAEKIEVNVDSVEGQARLTIKDYGLGIPEEARDKMFTKFYRVDNSDRRQIGGTGLGLAIVKEIVDAHEGSIGFSSQMGIGTTFTVMMHTYEVPSVDGAIIILEDDMNLAKLIQVALAKLQIPTVHLRSAEEGIIALHRVKDLPPVLCIVDIHLEGAKNGWDFMSELYRHPDYSRTPVIVSTALEPPMNYHEKDIEKFMRKPFSMEKLLMVVQQLLNNSNNHPAYVFPAQDEALIKSSLEKNGIKVNGVVRDRDTLHFELKIQPKDM